eukprot:1692597-Rhodomonas_salina.2
MRRTNHEKKKKRKCKRRALAWGSACISTEHASKRQTCMRCAMKKTNSHRKHIEEHQKEDAR